MEYMIIIFFFLLLLCAVLFYRYRFLKNTHVNLQSQIDNHVHEVESIYRHMRGIRHDYKNHLAVIEAHLRVGDLKTLESYLKQLNNELNQVDTIILTGNVTLDAIVNAKLSVAQDQGIRIEASAISPSKLPFDDIDIGIILGNLLTNAIEACLHVDASDRFIRLYIAPLQDNFYISVTNSMKQRPNPLFASLKRIGNERGFGLDRIDATVSKHNGYVNRQFEEGVFATEVMLPLR